MSPLTNSISLASSSSTLRISFRSRSSVSRNWSCVAVSRSGAYLVLAGLGQLFINAQSNIHRIRSQNSGNQCNNLVVTTAPESF